MREFVTEVLDDSQRTVALAAVINFPASKGVHDVSVEFGFVVERDLRGEDQGTDGSVTLTSLQTFIERELEDGTIEWSGTSDFVFSPVTLEMKFRLCNDSDLHFSSAKDSLAIELSHEMVDKGIKVYDCSNQAWIE